MNFIKFNYCFIKPCQTFALMSEVLLVGLKITEMVGMTFSLPDSGAEKL